MNGVVTNRGAHKSNPNAGSSAPMNGVPQKPPILTQHRRTAAPPKRLTPTPCRAAAYASTAPARAGLYHPSPPALASGRALRWLPPNSGGCAARSAAAPRRALALREYRLPHHTQLSQRAFSQLDDMRYIVRVWVTFWGAGGGSPMGSLVEIRGLSKSIWAVFIYIWRQSLRVIHKAGV